MKLRILRSIFFLFIGLSACTAGAQAQLMQVAGNDSANVFLERLDVDIKITGSIATTTWTMIFRNNAPRVQEGELTFPLGEGVTVSRYAIDINGQLREAVPIDKGRGTTVLEAIENRNIDPGLLERVEGNAFRTRIYPLPAGGTRTVLIAYEQTLRQEENGELEYNEVMAIPGQIPVLNLTASVSPAGTRPLFDMAGISAPVFVSQGNSWISKAQLLQYRSARPLRIRIPMNHQQANIVIRQEGNQTYALLHAPPRSGARSRKLPHDISIVWDASLSGMDRNHQAELAFLDKYFQQVRNAGISLSVFSNKLDYTRKFALKNGNWKALRTVLENMVYDGGTQLNTVNFDKLYGQEVLLFSDGISTLGTDALTPPHIPVWCIASAAKTDYPLLRFLAAGSGGDLINLLDLKTDEAIRQVTKQPLQIIGIRPNNCAREIFPNISFPAAEGGNFSCMLTRAKGEIYIDYGYGRQVTETQKIIFDLSAKQAQDAPLARIWAEQKIAALDVQYEQNRSAIEDLGRRFGLVTRNTSLIVLENVEDYIRYKVDPPAELREEYLEALNDRKETRNDAVKQRLGEADETARMLQEWWSKDYNSKPRPASSPRKTAEAPQPVARPRIPGTGGVAGFVRNSRGEAIIGANISVLEAGQATGRQNVTDYNGHYAIRALPAGVYSLLVSHLRTQSILNNVVVRQDTLTGLSITLQTIEDSLSQSQEIQNRAGSIKGSLKDEKGNPVANAGVEVSRDGIVRNRSLTDLDGKYQIGSIPKGSYSVKFSYGGKERFITGISLGPGQNLVLNSTILATSGTKDKKEAITVINNKPVIEQFRNSYSSHSAEAIERMPARSLSVTPGVSSSYQWHAARAMNFNSGASSAGTYTAQAPGAIQTATVSDAVFGDYSYDSSMLGNLRELAPALQYEKYLSLRKDKMQLPSFYFAVAGHFIAAGRKELGLRILTNLAELQLENYELYKMLGYKLKELGEYRLEAEVFRKVLAWRPMDPQSLRDYGLALADEEKYQAAIDTLYAAVKMDIDESLENDFEGIDETLLPEIGNLVALHKPAVRTYAIAKNHIAPLPADIRVVINWNMKNTDIDLWVTDPNGEKCYYGNNETAIGGRITNDFTGGFGPEQFMLRKAIPGKYRIEVNYFGDHQVKIAGNTTVMAEVYTSWGTAQQKRQVIVLQMSATEDKEGVFIGEFTFKRK